METTGWCDVLIVGGGTAALRAAVEAVRSGASVIVAAKGGPGLGLVGFNAPIRETGDSAACFFEDTVQKGAFLNDLDLAATLAYQASVQLDSLEKMGIDFQHEDRGYEPRLTSGNSKARTVYTTDRTGPDILARLYAILRQAAVEAQTGLQALAILTDGGRAAGAICYNRRLNRLEAIVAKAVVLATGGLGPLYAMSTNSGDLTGDGFVLAYRAGAELVDMEFVQYEPFVVINPPTSEMFTVSFLLDDQPEIYNGHREPVLENREGNPGKDALSRILYRHIQSGKATPAGGIYFDVTKVPPKRLATHARLLALCEESGFDPRQLPLEVTPAQHYLMGGVRVDTRCQTRVPGLFAAGEVAGGVHGAGRLAGSSGTDVLVFGALAGRFAAEYASRVAAPTLSDRDLEQQSRVLPDDQPGREEGEVDLRSLRTGLRDLMWQSVGIVREGSELEDALSRIQSLRQQADQLGAANMRDKVNNWELGNWLLLAEMICRASLLRQESRGVHYRSDFPDRDDVAWLRNTVFSQEAGQLKWTSLYPTKQTYPDTGR